MGRMSNNNPEKQVRRIQVNNQQARVRENDCEVRGLEEDGLVDVGVDGEGQVDPELRAVDGRIGRVFGTTCSDTIPISTKFGFFC